MMRFADLSAGPDGLVVAVVQDAATRSVLMVAYMNEEAFDATQASGQVHFWSRSRNELWRKGATSGNTLALADIRTDCDGDALLVLVNPNGTCVPHRIDVLLWRSVNPDRSDHRPAC